MQIDPDASITEESDDEHSESSNSDATESFDLI